ncbi:MAG: alpha/beta hydrolase [Candidatus Omnitrophica bacterium]|nr:alpha/beta hydrolase [Candidatus Omnitrophota bacterium]
MKASAPCFKGTLKTKRFLIPYRIYKNNGPHIICINGVQQSMAMWQTFVSRFCRDYRIVLFDFPNLGKARVISGSPLVSLEEQVEILSEVMDKTGTSPDGSICAASWGGVIAAAFAAKYRDRIKRLILASLGTKPNKKMIETIKKGSSLDMNNREQVAQTLIKSFGETLPPRIKQHIVNQFRTMKEESVRAFYEHGLFVVSSKQLSEIVDLRNIKAKTILINGEKDTIIDLEDVKFLASQIPDCELKIIKDVGHFLHMEREEVLDIYEDILRQ